VIYRYIYKYRNESGYSHSIKMPLIKVRNLSSHIDMHTHAGSKLHNPANLTFDLRSIYAAELKCTKFGVDNSSIFLLKHGHTYRPTDRQIQRQTYRHKCQLITLTTESAAIHLVASVLVENDEEYRHDNHGSEKYQCVA